MPKSSKRKRANRENAVKRWRETANSTEPGSDDDAPLVAREGTVPDSVPLVIPNHPPTALDDDLGQADDLCQAAVEQPGSNHEEQNAVEQPGSTHEEQNYQKQEHIAPELRLELDQIVTKFFDSNPYHFPAAEDTKDDLLDKALCLK